MSNNNFRSMINLLNNKLRLVREGYSDVSKAYLDSRKKLGEYTNFKDKVVIGDYTYISIFDSEDKWLIWGDIKVFDNLDGTEVANSSFGKESLDSELKASIDVRPDKRRLGIASNVYKMIEKITGNKLHPDLPHSDSAKSLWGNPNRGFGFDK